MKKLVAVLACLLMLAIAGAALADTVSIAVVYSDTVDDKGWCQTMDQGIKNAIAMGYDIKYQAVESVDPSVAPNQLDQLAGNWDVIIAHGAQFSAACTQIAEEYPEQIFALGTSDQILGDNIFTYMPQSEEPGYIDGVIAGLLTKNNKVGIVGSSDGGDSARFVRGFVLGLQSVNPEAAENYSLSWTGSFSKTVEAGDIARTFIEQGCDVLTGPAQQAVGAIRVVDSVEGVTWVGQTTSQIVDFPNVVAAAADYDYSAVIIAIVNALSEGKTGGECIPLNYNNGGFIYTFSENAELLPEDVKAAAQAALDALTAEANTLAYADVALKN